MQGSLGRLEHHGVTKERTIGEEEEEEEEGTRFRF